MNLSELETSAPLRWRKRSAFAWLLFVLSIQLVGRENLAVAAEPGEEQRLIGVLQSSAALAEKDAACSRLKQIGTEQCIAALAALLTDEQLSHSARHALESMQFPKAGAALVQALESSTGPTRLGIINSLGVRREPAAVPALARLLAPDANSSIMGLDDTIMAAAALGEISTPAAVSALQHAGLSSSPARQVAIADALLRSGYHLLAAGNEAGALAVFKRITAGTNETLEVAVQVGIFRASGKAASRYFVEALMGPPGAKQTAALQLLREAKFEGATKRLAELLPKVSQPVQICLIEGLAQREDPAAAPAIAALAGKGDLPVSIPAYAALGRLGNDRSVPMLAEAAASENAEEQIAARHALVELHRGPVTEALVAAMSKANAKVQAELARALGQRADPAAIPKLLQMARGDEEYSRASALQALAALSDQRHVTDLVQLVTDARTASARSQAAEALNTTLQRLQSRNPGPDVTPLVKALENGSTESRIVLLSVCSGLIDSRLRSALRQAVANSDSRIRAAAIRALCDTHDPALLPDVLKVATDDPEENFRTLATAACVRLTSSQEEGVRLSNEARLAPLKAVLAKNPSVAQKRMILAGLAEIPDAQALSLSEPLLDDPAVQTEAARTLTKVAPTVADLSQAISVLKEVLAKTSDNGTHQAAEAALKQIEARNEWITNWLAAGPYRQAGKDYTALFDVPFAPEQELMQKTANSSHSSVTPVQWRRLSPGSDPGRPGVMDLLKEFGGEQCVAYARTRIYSPAPQSAILELGTDDGVKVWLNEHLVHANNVARPLQPGSDKIDLNLIEGWNELLLKVTQNNQGWEFCARILKRDGSHPEGLKFAVSQ